jgi:tetratricopeptide (TPR) repeat protein
MIPAQITLAQQYVLKDTPDFRKADSLFNRVLIKQPNNYIAYASKGYHQLLKGDMYLAETYFRKSLEINPYYQYSIEHLIELLIKRGNINELNTIAHKYHEHYPNDAMCNYVIGLNYYNKGNFIAATSYLEIAEQNNPQFIYSYSQDVIKLLGLSYYKQKNYYNAIDHFKRLVINGFYDDSQIEVLMYLRQCYIQTNNKTETGKIESILKAHQIGFDETRKMNVYLED